MIRGWLRVAIATLTAVPATAASVQQEFEAAQALLDAGKAAQARDGFAALLKRVGESSVSRSSLLVRARLGESYLRLGEAETAAELLQAAADGLTRPDDAAERAVALYHLGGAAETMGRIDSAAARYRAALDLKALPADSPAGISLKSALARSLIWSAPEEATRLADEVTAISNERTMSGDLRALMATLRARIDLNNGRAAEARRRLLAAASAAGGAETSTVNATDIRVRGDLTIASHLLKLDEQVGRGTAFSGAGYLFDAGLTPPSEMALPGCQPETALPPDAVAVVEFGIRDDGKVVGALPVYASAGSAVRPFPPDSGPESLFVQLVRQWHWSPDQVAKVKPFWRQLVRIELRCTTARRPDSDPTSRTLVAQEDAWMRDQKLRPFDEQSTGDRVSALRAELARRERSDGSDSPQLLPVLRLLVGHWYDDVDRDEAKRLRLLETAGAPREVIGLAEVLAAQRRPPAEATALLRPLVQRYQGWGPSRILLLMQLRLAELRLEARDRDEAAALLDTILASSPDLLPEGDPIRTAALLRRADIAAAKRDLGTATAALSATGLAPEQCALVDLRPLPINRRISAESFPAVARQFGTEGMLGVGYDIDVDGKPQNVRTLWAMPPFLYNANTEAAVRRFRYQPVFRPGNSLGCSGTSTNVRYRMAN